ncbi:MAG: DUF6850 family outer membrane beta-barrel protein [Phocaeicola sp.]
MIKTVTKWTLLTVGVVAFSPLLSAQEKAADSFDFELTIDSIGWRSSSNVSQLFTLPLQRAGRAYSGYEYVEGNSLNYNQAQQQQRFYLSSEAYQRLSPRLLLYGLASFSTEQENQVAGSAFYAPNSKPFDITLDPTNLGNRKQEAYHLVGAVSYQLSPQWALGGKLDYEAINRARTKDLRHNNTILSLKALAALSHQLNKRLTIGVDYLYTRYIETLSFNTYGTTDQQFMSLINWGAFSGKQELFDNYGYTAKGANTPFVEQNHQLGIQVAWHIAPRLTLFNEWHAATAQGYYGNKATASVLYTEHDGSSWSNQMRLSYKGSSYFQQLTLSLAAWECRNYENEWRSETAPSGNNVINYYGQNLVGEKEKRSLEGYYLLATGENQELATWLFKAGARMEKRKLRSIIYPYYRSQELTEMQYQLAISHLFNFKKSRLWLNLGIAYRTGSGDSHMDALYTTPSTEVGTPSYQDTLLAYEHSYLTANKIAPQLAAQLDFSVTNLACFVQLKYELESLLQSSYTEKRQQQLLTRIGVKF